MVSSSKRQRESLSGRIQLLIEAMDRLGVRLERASRGPSLSLGPTKRMQNASHNEAATAVMGAEDVIDPHAAPVYRGPSTDDVENHLLCVVTPERSSYIRPTGKPGRYEQVWFDGSVTASPFSDGALRQCAVSKDWAMVYEPVARELVGLPALAELDHCREGEQA
jgi:hypothetical protein